MNESTREAGDEVLEGRSRALLRGSVDDIDFAMRSRLTQARHAALAVAAAKPRALILRLPLWKPMAGVAAAAVLGVVLWFGALSGTLSANHGTTVDGQTNLEDLDMVAASDPSSGDALEMLQDDLDFYDFADKASGTEPAV